MEFTPTGRVVITVQRGNDNNISLEPHTYVNDNGQNECESQTSSKSSEPEQLGADNITRHHDPIGPAIGSRETVDECITFILHTAIP
jgi:hypothetical protein